MRKEYDMSGGTRGMFYGKVDLESPIIDEDDGPIDLVIEDEIISLESNLSRIGGLRSRFAELDAASRARLSKRIHEVSEKLEELALPE